MGRPEYQLLGKQFGEWTVLSKTENRNGNTYWMCRCSCGTEKVIKGQFLVGERTHSCQSCSKNALKHGLSSSPEYRAHRAMLNRCSLPSIEQYPNYGGRGITVCQDWQGPNGFENFLKDVGFRPSGEHSLDRINPNGNYEPTNCKWSTRSEQSKNRRQFVAINNHSTEVLIQELQRRGIYIKNELEVLKNGKV